jgi:hypothetical protein
MEPSAYQLWPPQECQMEQCIPHWGVLEKVYLVKKSWNNGIMLELFASETVFAFFVK